MILQLQHVYHGVAHPTLLRESAPGMQQCSNVCMRKLHIQQGFQVRLRFSTYKIKPFAAIRLQPYPSTAPLLS